MDITVVGRNAEISSRLRDYVEDKAVKVEQFDPRVQAEASSSDRFAAFDIAMGKLTERLRRARDRKKDHHRRHAVAALNEGLQAAPVPDEPVVPETGDAPIEDSPSAPTEPGVAVEAQLGDSPVIVRQKLHEARPMTVDEALYQMELVGHPFYLFIEKSSKQPCAVYHRHGWTYGVIRLDAQVL